MFSFLYLMGAFGVALAAPRLAIRVDNGQERVNLDTLANLRSRVSFICDDHANSDTGSISLVNHVETELANASVGALIINSMSVEDQGTYRCSVESQSVDVAVITVPPDTTVQVVSAEGEQPTLSCPLGIVEMFSHLYTIQWRVPLDMTVAESNSPEVVPWARLDSSTLVLTVGPLNSTLPRVFECVVLSFGRPGLNSLTFSIAPKGIVNIIIPSVQQLRVTVSPSVIASGSNNPFNVSCGVENGQILYNAEYQFFLNGESTGTPSSSSHAMVPATSTGNFTCIATQYSDRRTPIPSQLSPPVQAIVLEAPILERTKFAPMSTDGCTQQVTGSLSQLQPVEMTLQYFFHSTAQPTSCTNALFNERPLHTSVSAGQTALLFEVNLIDSRLDSRQTVYLTSRFVMDGVDGPCSRSIRLVRTAEPCPPQPPLLTAGHFAGIAVGGVVVVVAAILLTVAVIYIARKIKYNQGYSYAVRDPKKEWNKPLAVNESTHV